MDRHAHDSHLALLTAVTGRTTPELAHDALVIEQGHHRVDTSAREHWLKVLQREGEWSCAGGESPRPTHPRLSAWRRLVLGLQRLRAGFRFNR